MPNKIISQGAEAKIILNKDFIIKDRISKSYRIPEIDSKIISRRTKAESKLLEKASKIINCPKPFFIPQFNKIKMPFINGKKLSIHLDKLKNKFSIAEQIGKEISKLHKENIIHGDLTTSNMILKRKEIFFIDFGLGFISHKLEDKAVDLHLLKQALEAKHYKNFQKLWQSVEKGYSSFNKSESPKVLERLKAVEKRGRYKKG